MNDNNEKVEKKKVITKVKTHVRKNKTAYISAGIGALVGALGTALLINKKFGMTDAQMHDRVIQQIRAQIQSHGYKPTSMIHYTEQTISIYGNKIGRPGTPVIDMTTGKRFESMTLAAEATGVSYQKLWKHLHGKTNHVGGRTFQLVD